MNHILRKSLLVLLITALIGGLIWLVYKTQAIDTSLHQQVNGKLSELKQVDAEWNLDILRSKAGINQNYDPINTPSQWLQENQTTLLAAISQTKTPEIDEATEVLRKAIDSKITLVDQFKAQHALLKNSLNFLPTAVTQLRKQIAEARNKEARNTPTETSTKPPKQSTELTDLEVMTNEMLTEVLKYNLTPDTAIKTHIEALITILSEQQSHYPEAIQIQLGMILNHTKTIMKQKASEDAVLVKIGQVPINTHINTLAGHFEQSFDAAITAQNTWRGALIAYSGGLLIALSFMGLSLWKSYRSLDQANASLEQRVKERTQDLSVALDHLKESQMQLIQSEKMASLGQMVAGIAHEINTPLAYVKGGLEILNTRIEDVDTLINETNGLMTLMTQEEGADEQQLAEQFNTVQEITSAFVETEAVGEIKGLLGDGLHGIDQIAEIVRNLKDFSRLDRARMDQFNVNDGIISTLNIARNIVKYRKIVQHLGEVPAILCSPSQINQVFLNLINNACQATTDENSTVTITTRSTLNGVAVEIRDNGQGIPNDVLPKIFDPFFTTKKVGEGTGLGLSIVQRIIKEHGGEVQVVSTVNEGTCFTVLLPRKAPTPS